MTDFTQDEIAAMKTLVGRIDVADAQADPGIFNKRIYGAIQKILDRYEKNIVITWVHFDRQNGIQANIEVEDRPKPPPEEG